MTEHREESGEIEPVSQPAEENPFVASYRLAMDQVRTEPKRAVRWKWILIPLVSVFLFVLAIQPLRSGAMRVAGLSVGDELAGPTVVPSLLTYCDDVSESDHEAIEAAAAEMRRTARGRELQNLLEREMTCIGVIEMEYIAGYTTYREDTFGNPTFIFIMINPYVLDIEAPDEVAALLIHEAAHAERMVNETSCTMVTGCEELPNGTFVEEEVAAHGEEAEFWMEIHGPDGTRRGVSFTGKAGAGYLNRLLDRYQQGPEAFREFVILTRSNMREANIFSETPESDD